MNHLWYALHVRSRLEKLVQNQLESKGYETFLPLYTALRGWSDRTKRCSQPLFSNYVFCRFDIRSRLPILITPGVKAVVGHGKMPIAVDEMELETIRRVLESKAPSLPWSYLREGERVTVMAGPLTGLTGIVVREKGCDRLVISITLLMRSVAVEIDRRCVKPVNDSAISELARSFEFHRKGKIA
jgi:transcription antitermination factor NusG